MLRYETLYLTVPEITADESATIERQLEKLIKDHTANFIACDRWGKYKLAYIIRKNEYGVYFLVRFEVDNKQSDQLLDAIQNFFSVKYNDLVMRFMTSKLDAHKPLTYQRPESLEEAPARERESGGFFKEKKGGMGYQRRNNDMMRPERAEVDIEEQI